MCNTQTLEKFAAHVVAGRVQPVTVEQVNAVQSAVTALPAKQRKALAEIVGRLDGSTYSAWVGLCHNASHGRAVACVWLGLQPVELENLVSNL